MTEKTYHHGTLEGYTNEFLELAKEVNLEDHEGYHVLSIDSCGDLHLTPQGCMDSDNLMLHEFVDLDYADTLYYHVHFDEVIFPKIVEHNIAEGI